MADTMKFDLVTPECLLASGEALSVQIPSAEGQMTAMPDHAPIITTLRPGILRVEMSDGVKEFAVTGGFAEINADGTSILAERAYPKGSDGRADIEARLEEAKSVAASASDAAKDAADLAVSDLTELLDEMV